MKTCPVDKTIESRSFDPPIGISGCQKCESLKKTRLNIQFNSTLPGKANFPILCNARTMLSNAEQYWVMLSNSGTMLSNVKHC